MTEGAVRLQFHVSYEFRGRLDVLRNSMDLPSRAALFRKAIRLTELIHALHEEGYAVQARKGDEVVEIEIL
jgi:hypothetical protein